MNIECILVLLIKSQALNIPSSVKKTHTFPSISYVNNILFQIDLYVKKKYHRFPAKSKKIEQ